MNKNGFAPTPPMGWNSYDYYGTTVREDQVKANADYMAEHLKEYGWEYIVISTSFSPAIDEYSRLLPDPVRFPSSANGAGFKPLADYLHKLGLKFGIHIKGGLPGNLSQTDCDDLLELYASRGIDLIRYDAKCPHDAGSYPQDTVSSRDTLEMLSNAIKRCGRPIVLSFSPEAALLEEGWYYGTHTNTWMIKEELPKDFNTLKDVFYRCELWQTHVRKGCYPDCGMLPLGLIGSFTLAEARTMMTLWCLFGSPLMLGADLSKLGEEALGLLTNRQILAMLTPDCIPHQICRDHKKAIWQADDDSRGTHYVALFNLWEEKTIIRIPLQDLGYYSSSAKLTELWTGNLRSTIRGRITASVEPHGCVAYRVEF